MHLSPVQIYNRQNLNPIKFKSSERAYVDTENKRIIRNDTLLFRDDVNFKDLARVIDNNFKDKSKINIYSLACSDGSEPYSLAIALKENTSENTQKKCFPIIASDRDTEMKKAWDTKQVNLSLEDVFRLEKYTDDKGKYFTVPDNAFVPLDNDTIKYRYMCFAYQATDELAQSVKFENADLLDKVKDLKDDGNSVLLCRNVTPYLSDNEIDTLITTVDKNLKPNSLFVCGQIDHRTKMIDYLESDTFNRIGPNIYKKVK